MKDILFTVEYNKPLTKDVFELNLVAKEKLGSMRAGQFIHLEVPDSSLLLRRPFCLYKYDERSVTLIIAEVGKGTKALSTVKKGDTLKGIIPIGNGFTLEGKHKKIALLGGGVGCAPLLGVTDDYKDEKKDIRAYLGFTTKDAVMFERDFSEVCATKISTDDGSCGYSGYVTDMLKADIESKAFVPDVILVCGSENMLKAAARLTLQTGIPAYMSGESRMACGVGACLVCACKLKTADGGYRNVRACVDGPVFKLEDVIL